MGSAGLFVEPAAATAYAGLVKALNNGLVDPDSKVLVMATGSGLKDVKAAMSAVTSAPVIEPALSDLKEVLHV